MIFTIGRIGDGTLKTLIHTKKHKISPLPRQETPCKRIAPRGRAALTISADGESPLNATPVLDPYAKVLDEVNGSTIRPMMDDIKQAYKDKLKTRFPVGRSPKTTRRS
jgi:hypothetical protein